jgi:hypothetical protein
MRQRTFVVTCGTLLTLAGLALSIRGGAPETLRLFGVGTLPPPAAGEPAWVGLAFMRVFGAALAGLGLTTIGASRLRGEAARVLGAPLAIGLAVLGLVTFTQALAIWSTPAAWLLGGLIAVTCVSVASWRPVEQGVVTR